MTLAIVDATAERECLWCGNTFQSPSPGHRKCPACKEKEQDAERCGTPKIGLTARPVRIRIPTAELREIVAAASAGAA